MVAACALLFAGAAAATAHSQLESTVPAAGATVARPPANIELRFSEDVRVPNGGLRVLDEGGTRVDRNSPRAEGSRVRLPMSGLARGAYVVSWRVVSADGHPVRGAFTFRVGDVGDQSKVALLARRLLSSSISRTDVAALYALLRIAGLLALVILVGTVVSNRSDRRMVPWTGRRRRRVLATAGVVAGVSGFGTLFLFGPFVTGRPLGAVRDRALLNDTLRDHTGRAILVRTVALCALAYVLTRPRVIEPDTVSPDPGRRATMSNSRAATVLLGLCVVIGQVETGHGAAGRYATAAAILSTVHVIAASAWVGGLLMLASLILPSARDDREPVAVTVAVARLRRFSTIAMTSVAALVVSGAFASWRQVGSIRALRTTTYGRLLIIKLTIVAAMLVAGAYNRRFLRTAADAPSSDPERDLGVVRRRVCAEAIGGMLVIAVTALLVNSAPARDVVARPQSSTLRAQTILVDLTVAPARRGRNEIHLYALTREGLPKTVTEISGTAELPSAGVAPIPLRLVRAGPNHFQVLVVELPIAGTWRITARVRVDAFTEEVATGTVTVAK